MKPGNPFNLTYPQSSGQGSEADVLAQEPKITRETPIDNTPLPDYLSEWYQGYDGRPEQERVSAPVPQGIEQYRASGAVPHYSGIQNYLAGAGEIVPPKKVKFVFKKSLQVVTVAFLVIAASLAAGFVYLDRKVNLSEANESLGRMSGVLAQESAAVLEENLPAQDVSPLERTAEYKPRSEDVAGQTESRAFNASGNTNVSEGASVSAIDSDQDGITDETEEKLGTNPFNADTDGDGYPDQTELQNGFSPTVPAQTPNSAAVLGANASAESGVVSAAAAPNHAAGCAASGNASGEQAGAGQVSTSQGASATTLTTEDYSSLNQLGLSNNDINLVASGGASDMEKIQMQQSILGSATMQDSIGTIVGSVPNVGLPEIKDEELNLFNSEDKKDIGEYIASLLKTMDKHLGSFQNMDAEVVRNQAIQGDESAAIAMGQAFTNLYTELKGLKTPLPAKDLHKGFLTIFLVYSRLFDIGVNGNAEDMPILMSQMKAAEDLEPMMMNAIKELSTKYGIDLGALGQQSE